jgi:hypothetical protein
VTARGVVGVHEHGIARGAGEGIDFVVDEGVELFATPCGEKERSGPCTRFRDGSGGNNTSGIPSRSRNRRLFFAASS